MIKRHYKIIKRVLNIRLKFYLFIELEGGLKQMGTYLIIPKKVSKSLLKAWFNKWKPFYNDFGQEHAFEDVFGDILVNGDINFKVGVMDKEFYSREAIKEIEKIIEKTRK